MSIFSSLKKHSNVAIPSDDLFSEKFKEEFTAASPTDLLNTLDILDAKLHVAIDPPVDVEPNVEDMAGDEWETWI